MVKSGTSKSVWAQFGLRGKSRDTGIPVAPVGVSEDAQAKSIDKKAANLQDFNRRNPDRLPERPNTSAGPASTFAKRKTANKRETKDDLHFNPLAVHGRQTTFYDSPVPGLLPTPEHSPKTAAPSIHESSLVQPSTPQSLEIASTPTPVPDTTMMMNVPQGQIGMALGSPSHAPASWQEYSVETYIRHESPDQMDVSVDGSWDNPPPKHKPSRWKILGGIFGAGKKASPAFYQLEPEQAQPSVPDHVWEPISSSTRPKSRGRGWSNSTKRKHKPDLSRSHTTPAFTMSGAESMTGTPEIRLDRGLLIDNASNFPPKGAGLLDVDIPSIQMERYSIMFSGVLQGSGQTSSSSLLARRQATLDRLKTVNDALALKEQEIETKTKLLTRRGTSPSTMKNQSPWFSLFPNTPSRTKDLSPSSRHHLTGDLQRPNTSPAALSPSRPSFAPGLDNTAHARIMAQEHDRTSSEKIRNAPDSQTNRLKKESGPPLEASPTSPVSPWSPNKSHLALDDNSEVEDDEEATVDSAINSPSNPLHFPMKPKLVEPDWQIINPSHAHSKQSISGSTTSGSAHSRSTPNSSSISTLNNGLPKKPNMSSPPLTSSSPRVRAMSASRPSQTRSQSAAPAFTSSTPRRSPQPNAESIDSPTLHPEPIRSLNNNIISPSSHPKSRPSVDSLTEDENQARLTLLVNVSIARQISVSRQQRQLLIPLKIPSGSLRRSPGPSPDPSVNSHSNSKPNTPAPGVVKTTSALTAIAIATHEASTSSSPPAKAAEPRVKAKERLVDGVKAVTPTVVIVPSEREEEWDSATRRLKIGDKIMGMAERRRMMMVKNGGVGSGNGNGGNENGGDERRRERDLQVQMLLQNRKSERVVVESCSVVSP